jgi:preprotein translocase subunit SecG
MLDILLIVQVVIVSLIVISVLLQQTGDESLTSSGGSNVISDKASNKFMTKTIFCLAIAFMVNSLLLAKLTVLDINKSNKILDSISESVVEKSESPIVPISE